MKKIIIAILMLASQSFAANEGRGGGVGRMLEGKLYLQDLVVAGLNRRPHYDTTVAVDPFILQRMQKVFEDQPLIPTAKLAQKITEISKVNLIFAFSIVRAIELYSWRYTDVPLTSTYDESGKLQFPPNSRVQIADRENQTITVVEPKLKLMDEWNRVGFVIHEAVGSLYIDGYAYSGNAFAREQVVGFVLSKDLKADNEESKSKFLRVANDNFVVYATGKSDLSRFARMASGQNVQLDPYIVIYTNDSGYGRLEVRDVDDFEKVAWEACAQLQRYLSNASSKDPKYNIKVYLENSFLKATLGSDVRISSKRAAYAWGTAATLSAKDVANCTPDTIITPENLDFLKRSWSDFTWDKSIFGRE